MTKETLLTKVSDLVRCDRVSYPIPSPDYIAVATPPARQLAEYSTPGELICLKSIVSGLGRMQISFQLDEAAFGSEYAAITSSLQPQPNAHVADIPCSLDAGSADC